MNSPEILRPSRRISLLVATCLLSSTALFAGSPPPLDLSRQPTLFEIGYSHLDTEWRWGYPKVVREFIPNTVDQNMALFAKYPDYIFNWSGANRYRLMQEYLPGEFAKVKRAVAAGKWWPAGSSWEENDVDLPSAESLVRQLLFGHDYFKKEFGTESDEFLLPDCFGFPASLPSVLAHCGIRGFSTQKLTWNSAVGIPFNVGEWIGPDGNSVIAALNPGRYRTQITADPGHSDVWLKRLAANGAKSGVFADYAYYGAGDQGGAPDENSVRLVEQAVTQGGPVRVLSARSNEMFDDITDAQKARLPKYRGDLLLVEHSAGSLTSEAYVKGWNHADELLADAAERASVAAQVLGAAPYPREKLNHAWGLFLTCQFHDMMAGTALPKVYEYVWNDQILAMNSFAEVLRDAVGAVATGLDTRGEGVPLVVYNPLSIAREDVVEAEVNLPGAGGVQVFGGDGQPLPTQLLAQTGEKCRFLFLARVPSVGFSVFSVRVAAPAPAHPSPLRVTDRSLENGRYRVVLNESGDIANVFDKSAQRELLSAPSRLAFLQESQSVFPAWNMYWRDRKNPPRGYVDGPATIQIVEAGPVRVALRVERAAEHSTFVQTISLAAGDAGDHVEIANRIDWQSKGCTLKAEFPLTVSNPEATYNWELGKIARANNDPRKFEVPSHEWFDLTDRSGDYGISILCPRKYGSDKPSDNVVRLTLLYTPRIVHGLPPTLQVLRQDSQEQRWQDWGRHDIVYGIYGHAGDWRAGASDWQALRLDQPLLAFTTAAHGGPLGRSFSLLQVDSRAVAVRAVKLAENSDEVIVRLQELNGAPEHRVGFSSLGLKGVVEVNGVEEHPQPIGPASGPKLDFKPYQLRSLALTLASPVQLPPPQSAPVALPYNLAAFSTGPGPQSGDFDGHGSTIPGDMIGDIVTSEGIRFQIGPRTIGRPNAVKCEGQTIALPPGSFNRLYLLAAAVNGDSAGNFSVGGGSTRLEIQNWTGSIGSWDNRVFVGDVPEAIDSVNNPLARIDAGFIKRDPLGWFCSHRVLPDGKAAVYSYSYLFKYVLAVPHGAKTLTLPENPNLRIVAASMAQDGNEATQPAHPLYDDFAGRPPITLDPTWANSD